MPDGHPRAWDYSVPEGWLQPAAKPATELSTSEDGERGGEGDVPWARFAEW